jgi:dTDP-4-amino-4,6-dideoxygalactose transaminase
MRHVHTSIEQSVPFVDLRATNAAVETAVLGDIAEIIETSHFIGGKHVVGFENAFAEYVGTTECVGVASGLDALRLALAALDLEPGAEVVVPAMTFFATWEAVSQVGAIPLPVDVSPTDLGIDVAAVDAVISDRTAAVMPVHLYGQMVDMVALTNLSERRGIPVIEDAAQAHGATRSGIRAGSAGVAAGFSFYPGKNLGAMGDAGALVTDDPEIAARARSLREHGQRRKYHHDEIGWTARLDAVQAAVLARKLPLLDGWNDSRRRIAGLYLEGLNGVGDIVLPPVAAESSPVWHLFVIRTGDPDGLSQHLTRHGVATGRHYPEPPHLARAYASLGYREGAFPVAERVARECLSLPIFAGMTETQVSHVVDAVSSWFAGD